MMWNNCHQKYACLYAFANNHVKKRFDCVHVNQFRVKSSLLNQDKADKADKLIEFLYK